MTIRIHINKKSPLCYLYFPILYICGLNTFFKPLNQVWRAPTITESDPSSGILNDVSLGEEKTLSCQADALPTADIIWLDSQVYIH